MIVSRKQLRQIRSKRWLSNKDRSSNVEENSNKKYELFSFEQQGPQDNGSSRKALRDIQESANRMDSNSACIKSNQKFIQIKSIIHKKSQENLYFSFKNQKATQKKRLDIDLSNEGLDQFVISLPNDIDSNQINSLNMSHNLLKQILPTSLVPFVNLKQLNLSHNNLQKAAFPYNKLKLQKLYISNNQLSSLNLEHLKNLKHVDASMNKLIFLTLPQRVKYINLSNNSMTNIYFMEKCKQVEELLINFNFLYDLNFETAVESELKKSVNRELRKSVNEIKYPKLRKIHCSHNKISRLHGLANTNNVEDLQLNANELTLSRQNMNQLIELENLKNLNLLQNPISGMLSREETFEFILNKLTSLETLNGQTKWMYSDQKVKESEENNVQMENSQLQDSLSLNQSGQKPFRLFLDEQKDQKSENNKNKQTVQKKTKQWIYTLGDTSQKQDQNDAQTFKLMTLSKEENNFDHIQNQKGISKSYDGKNIPLTRQFNITQQKIYQNDKISQLQSQILAKQKSREIPLPIINCQTSEFELNLQNRSILKMLFQLSFIPPSPIRISSKTLISSRRLDVDDDEFVLMSRLFAKKKGIMYLKKIYLLEQFDFTFQNGDQLAARSYQLSFFNHPNVQKIYKEMLSKNYTLEEVLQSSMKKSPYEFEIDKYLCSVPNSFSCYHILVRHLSRKLEAFQKRSKAPVCYLVQAKNF